MFRMSISWSRIFPNGIEEEPNKKGLDFYMDGKIVNSFHYLIDILKYCLMNIKG